MPAAQCSCLGKIADKFGKLFGALERNRVVVAGTHATDGTVTGEASEAELASGREELLLRRLNITILAHAEANVHAGAHILLGNNLVDVGVGVKGVVDELGLLGRDLLLAGDTVGVGLEELLENLASNVDTTTIS